MEPPPQHLLPRTEQDKHLHLPHKNRWEALKPVIIELYTGKYGKGGKAITMAEVVTFMKAHYSFHAAQSEYPGHFRTWKVTKRVVNEDMGKIVRVLGRRKRTDASSSRVTVMEGGREKPVDSKKIRRFLKNDKITAATIVLPPGFLSSWNLPYSAFVNTLPQNPDHPSPFGTLQQTPSAIKIASPGVVSPGHEATTPSPNMQLVFERARKERVGYFLRGQRDELLRSMCREDRRIMVDYFHDLFLHGFIMAKYWGQEVPSGISVPSAAIGFAPSPGTAQITMNSPVDDQISATSSAGGPSRIPTSLCKWAIHVSLDIFGQGEDSWPTDDGEHLPQVLHSFQESLQKSVISGDFTNTPAGNLPLDKEVITELLKAEGGAMAVDAWRLAIMSGNGDLVKDLCRSGDALPAGLGDIFPYHLAASFLDGGRTCCKVFEVLPEKLPPFRFATDTNGHTILDALLVSVLRSHTRIDPGLVSASFRASGRFPGEEKDICGRWDADTPSVRELHKQGHMRIPPKWKHPFCHTSAQAVCHSLIAVYLSPTRPNLNAPSGLFVRRCARCGTEMRLGPLHSLVVSAFYMAQAGMDEETLFGALAVAVCLLALGADPSSRVEISINDIQGSQEDESCKHLLVTPSELMRALPTHTVESWSDSLRSGWTCLDKTLAYAESSFDGSSSSLASQFHRCSISSDGLNLHEEWIGLPCNSPKIGRLWALIQAELLTYRRLQSGDSWISDNFLMKDAVHWLQDDTYELTMPLAANDMMQSHSPCGWFFRAAEFMCPSSDEVSSTYFMNFATYDGRASYIDPPNLFEGIVGDIETNEDYDDHQNDDQNDDQI